MSWLPIAVLAVIFIVLLVEILAQWWDRRRSRRSSRRRVWDEAIGGYRAAPGPLPGESIDAWRRRRMIR